MNIKSRMNWTRSAIAFTLLCAVFSFSLIAQDAVKPDLDAAAALVQRLTDGLPDLIDNEEQVTAIVEKWEARQGLSGKTKSQILNLLFADVKSVVKDKETQDSIWTGLNETVSGDTETDELDDKAGKQPDAPVDRSARVPLQPARPVTREITEPNIEVQRLGSYVDGPWTVIGAYFATSYESAPVCVRPPGSRLTNRACIKAQELKIPAGSPPEYLCESKEGKGNCRLYGSVWIPKTCNYGYRYFLWRRTASGAEGTMPMGNSLICTSGTTPVPGEAFVTGNSAVR